MKLLIIAGPYEADRIRKAAVAAGFESLAVEPGESLSGWITASRPDLIVMAPQIVHADPALALAKVRNVPRGRVPVFLVGDASEEDRMRNLAEGFFVRPIAPEILLAQARAILTPKGGQQLPDFERTEMGLGVPVPRPAAAQPDFERTAMGLGTAGVPVPIPTDAGGSGGRRAKTGPISGRAQGLGLKPLVAPALSAAPIAPARSADSSRLLADLNAGIDDLLEAELQAVIASTKRSDAGTLEGFPHSPATDSAGQSPAPSTRKEITSPGQEFVGEPTKKADPEALADAAWAVQKKKPPRVQKPPKTSPGMPSPPAVAPAEDARARLMRRHAVVEQGDYFAVLGVNRDATPDDVRRAHAAILHDTSAPAVDDALARELADQIADIRTVADEALRILTDERLRRRYASHL